MARHALELHDLLGARLGLGDHDREVLEAAALLANVGLFISHSSHHKHSYYVIRNAEHLTGFTDEEKELIAQVARYHRKGDPSVVKHPEFAALPEAERERVRSMAALLRVAIALDRNHDGGVRCVSLGAPSEDSAGERADSSADDGTTTLVVHPEGDRSLELRVVQRRGPLVAAGRAARCAGEVHAVGLNHARTEPQPG
ncbi:MAG: HD domain-containing protein [Microthrixaceae bacterium]|nr:HD domain-containing protein [Microthrixaceae bacterium]